MKRHVIAALLLGVFLLSAHTAPSYAEASPQAASQPQATAKVPELTAEQLKQWTGKLNIYVGLYNRSARAIDSWRRYKSWVNLKTGPTGKERIVYGLYSTYDDVIKELAPNAAEAAKREPQIAALDTAAQAYVAALEKLDPILRDAYNYYNRKEYSDDKFAKGKELHPKLVEAFETVEKTRNAFDTELTTVKAQIDEQELALIEKVDGRKTRWHVKRMMMASLRAIEAAKAVESKNDLPALAEAIKKYATIVGEFDDYATAAANDTTLSVLQGRPDELLASLREARDALEKGNAAGFNGAANKAVSDYNMLVNLSRF